MRFRGCNLVNGTAHERHYHRHARGERLGDDHCLGGALNSPIAAPCALIFSPRPGTAAEGALNSPIAAPCAG